MGQGLRACLFNRFQSIGENGSEDIDHLAVATGLTFQFALNAANGRRQLPFFERRAIA